MLAIMHLHKLEVVCRMISLDAGTPARRAAETAGSSPPPIPLRRGSLLPLALRAHTEVSAAPCSARDPQ
mgnify:CR=1 FL=1